MGSWWLPMVRAHVQAPAFEHFDRTALLAGEWMLTVMPFSCYVLRHAGTTGMMCSDEHHISVMQNSVAVCMFLTR